jgi:pimeloyl-ACP methyl ester carboxylesterase
MAAAMNAPRLEALHFGRDQRLFGLRSEPILRPRQTAIVICQSWGAESMRCYRGLHLLAQQLAERGFETLRFDYTGTGDSADVDDAPLSLWLDDIRDAADELRELSGARRIALLGLRLGALLATEAADAARADDLLLWDAPASGQQWSEQMQKLNLHHYERKNRTRPAALRLNIPDDELLGAPWPAHFADAIAALQLKPSERSLRHFHSADMHDAPAETHTLPDASQWDDLIKLDAPWVPVHSITQLCDQLAKELP